MENNKFDFEAFMKEASEKLKQGKPFTGQDGVFTPLIKKVLEASLEGELDAHLEQTRESNQNRRNGRNAKNLKSSLGAFEIFAPRDRNGSFQPQTLPKRQRIISSDLDEKIISLFARGMSYQDIRSSFNEMYGVELSDATLSAITDRIIPEIKDWQNRPLESVYPVLWLDAMFFKVREDGVVKSKAVYSILGVSSEGSKEVLGVYFGQSESSAFWRQVLNDLKARGIEDILIVCIDNLKGFADAIEDFFPDAEVQLCLVHQMRNSIKYLNWRDLRACIRDLKNIYKANNQDQALSALGVAEQKWAGKYPAIFKSWRSNWNRLVNFLKYPKEIRKLIYTTNPIESYHRMVRKTTKTKGAFTSETAILKQIYLATMNAQTKWNGQMFGWSTVSNQFKIYFGERFKTHDTV